MLGARTSRTGCGWTTGHLPSRIGRRDIRIRESRGISITVRAWTIPDTFGTTSADSNFLICARRSLSTTRRLGRILTEFWDSRWSALRAVLPNSTSKLGRKIKIMQRSVTQKMLFKRSPVCDGIMRVRLNKHKICKIVTYLYEDIFEFFKSQKLLKFYAHQHDVFKIILPPLCRILQSTQTCHLATLRAIIIMKPYSDFEKK